MEAKQAIVTGASMGLGRAIAASLAERGWHVIADARDGERLRRSVEGIATTGAVTAIAGDVTDPRHRRELANEAHRRGRLDLLVNNASVLGPSPQPALAAYPPDELERVFAVNAVAPIALFGAVAGLLAQAEGTVVNVTSDASVEAYEGWGGYGASKAALDQATAVLAAEHPELRVYAFDPGDMATEMHRQAFPGEDISDRPAPATVIPAFLRLVTGDLPSGRHRAADLIARVAS